MVSAVLTLLLLIFLQISQYLFQTYSGVQFRRNDKEQIPSTNFKALFTMDDDRMTIHRCFYFCAGNKQCIGVEICRINDDLFQCRTGCEWKKLKKYANLSGPSNCTYYDQETAKGHGPHVTFPVALLKPATFSSPFDRQHRSSHATDGITACRADRIAPEFTVAASSNSANPWLLIDLERTHDIRMVTVYARTENYSRQLDNIVIMVNNGNSQHICGGEYAGPTTPYDVISFPCASESIGSSVTILKTVAGILGLCEVEIFGY